VKALFERVPPSRVTSTCSSTTCSRPRCSRPGSARSSGTCRSRRGTRSSVSAPARTTSPASTPPRCCSPRRRPHRQRVVVGRGHLRPQRRLRRGQGRLRQDDRRHGRRARGHRRSGRVAVARPGSHRDARRRPMRPRRRDLHRAAGRRPLRPLQRRVAAVPRPGRGGHGRRSGLAAKSGKPFTSAGLARELGFTDTDGRIPEVLLRPTPDLGSLGSTASSGTLSQGLGIVGGMGEPTAEAPAMADYGVGGDDWSPLPWAWRRAVGAHPQLLGGHGVRRRPARGHASVGRVGRGGQPLHVLGQPQLRKARNIAPNPTSLVMLDDTVECVSVEGVAR